VAWALFAYQVSHSQVTINYPHLDFTVNNTGLVQVVDNQGVSLLSSDAEALKHYSGGILSPIGSIDKVSSLKTLVFYPEIPAIQVLDNTLSEQGDLIDLNQAGLTNIVAIAMSSNNTFWGFDGASYELLQFDDGLHVLTRSVSTIASLGITLRPTRCIIKGKRICLLDSARGIYLFDQFGNYISHIEQKGILDMLIDGNQLYYLGQDGLHRTSLAGASDSLLLPLEVGRLGSIDIALDHIYIGDGKKITAYPLENW